MSTDIDPCTHMCNSTEICDETRNVALKIFFRAHRGQVFLVVCNIYKRNSWLNRVHRIVYFFWNNFLLQKLQKKPFSSNLSHLAQNRSTQSFKKEIKTRKKGINSFFLKLKNVDSFKSYKGLKFNVKKA